MDNSCQHSQYSQSIGVEHAFLLHGISNAETKYKRHADASTPSPMGRKHEPIWHQMPEQALYEAFHAR